VAASVSTEPQGSSLLLTKSQYRTPSVGWALSQASAALTAATDVPRLEAEVLLAHVLGSTRRYASGYPLPYLTGLTEFYGLEFEVTPEVLIPRPETEKLVDLARARQPKAIVDVGTGSGCIAVSLAVHLRQATVCAIEISPAALAVARRNVERHGVADRIQLMVGDVLNPRPAPADLIVSNPPYVRTGDCASLPISVRNHEPRPALDGGPDGLAVIRQLLAQAPAMLSPGGGMLIEIGADQGRAARDVARSYFPEAMVCVHPDLAGRDRVIEVQT
jgi:release factor glutamine methyltransferase